MQLEHDVELGLFQKARELLAQGWTQDVYGRKGVLGLKPSRLKEADCFCSLGAVRRAAEVLELDVDGFRLEAHVASRMGFTFRMAVADWNDHHNRTQDQVLAKFDEIIAALQPEG